MSVSILTPCQENRFHLLPLNLKTIESQTYENIVEWVVVDGTPGKPSLLWEKTLENLRAMTKLQIIDAGKLKYRTIGCARNSIIDHMSGEFGVWMDDDDVYPITRVQVAVELMIRDQTQVAGCSRHFITDPTLGNMTFQFKLFHPNHATNNTLAFRRSYTERYDDHAEKAEEMKYLNNFRTKMSQIPSEHACVQLAHSSNTFGKRELMLVALSFHHRMPILEHDISCRLVSNGIGSLPYKFINTHPGTYASYVAALVEPPKVSTYDVVWYMGMNPAFPAWSPIDSSLGGSEQAVLHLSEAWVKSGLRVAVYGNVRDANITHHGVDYFHCFSFRGIDQYNNLIIWRLCGYDPIGSVPLHARRLILDVHDRFTHEDVRTTLAQSPNMFDCVCLKSKFHAQEFASVLDWSSKFFVHPNGVREDIFFDEEKALRSRDRYRFVYCSSYTRGLRELLLWFFPTLRAMDDRFTLHVMYGFDGMDENSRKMYLDLMKQPGVVHYGRLDASEVREQKFEASYHLYYTATKSEIDCISIRESALCGCIPILSDLGVFSERVGLHFPNSPTNELSHRLAAAHFYNAYFQNEQNEINVRKKCVEMSKGITWEVTADSWIENVLDLLPEKIISWSKNKKVKPMAVQEIPKHDYQIKF